jgi:hypothetical protein
MFKIIISIFIFCIVLFLYLHIQFHYKTSNDLEIFEIEKESKETLEEICDLRQPVLFELEEEHTHIIQQINKQKLLDNYPSFDVKIRETIVYPIDSESELYIPLHFHIADKLFNKDNNSKYFSENNQDFLNETGILKIMQQNDYYLRPPLVSNCNYDILMGSTGAITPFRYNVNYRNFYIVTQGEVRIKLAPPKSIKYLHSINDYENFEFRSPVNPWDPQSKFINDFNKIKCLEIILKPGKCFYIPAYWYYSFQFAGNTSICCFQYKTYMNNIAIIPDIAMYTLQTTNVERKMVKKLDIENLFTNTKNINKNINENIKINENININENIEINEKIEDLNNTNLTKVNNVDSINEIINI